MVHSTWTSSLAAVMAIGLAWYWLKRPACDAEKDFTTPVEGDSNIERFGLYAGIFMGLGLSITNGAKGWFNIYRTDIPEDEWFRIIWSYLGPVYLGILILIALWILIWPQSRIFRSRRFPHAYGLMWLVLIVQNAIAFAITGPYSNGKRSTQAFAPDSNSARSPSSLLRPYALSGEGTSSD